MKFYDARWVSVAWLDTLLKRIFDLALAGTVTLLAVWGLSFLDASDVRRKNVLYGMLLLVGWLIVASVRLIVHTIRAAISGNFLDEYAAAKASKAQEVKTKAAKAYSPPVFDPHFVYKGQDPIQAGRPLKRRIDEVWFFQSHQRRMPALDAPHGTDEYFFAETLKTLARAVDSGVATPDELKRAKYVDSFDNTWREVYGRA